MDVPIHYPPPASFSARSSSRTGKSGRRGDEREGRGKASTESSPTKDTKSGGANSTRSHPRTEDRRQSRGPRGGAPHQPGSIRGPRRGSNASVTSTTSATGGGAQPVSVGVVGGVEQVMNPATGMYAPPRNRRGGGRTGGGSRGRSGMPRPRQYYGYVNGHAYAPAAPASGAMMTAPVYGSTGYNSYGYTDPESVDFETIKWWIRTQM